MPPRTSREKACQHARDCKAEKKKLNCIPHFDNTEIELNQVTKQIKQYLQPTEPSLVHDLHTLLNKQK